MHTVRGLATVADAYDGFILDLWGVIHDGVAPFADALDCMRRLAGRPILLLSNAPRRAASVQCTLRRLGVDDSLYTQILTSGEATWQMLRAGGDAQFESARARILHIGPERDRGIIEGFGATLVFTPAEADFVLNTGPDDERETSRLSDFLPDLAACLDADLPMICANPDLEIVRGDMRILCAGTLAGWYEANGGAVRWIGKPEPAIYQIALAMMGLGPDRVLAVGDSLRTDIAGAARAGIDSLWVLSGLHDAELGGDPAAAARLALATGLAPKWVAASLAW